MTNDINRTKKINWTKYINRIMDITWMEISRTKKISSTKEINSSSTHI